MTIRKKSHRKIGRSAPGIVLSLFLSALLAYLLGWSPLFSIKSIEISAAGYEKIITALVVPDQVHVGLPLARVSLGRISRDLLHQSWVREITIKRHWLARDLTIAVIPRIPIAQFREQDGSTKYFDKTGVSFSLPSKTKVPSELPTVTFNSSTQIIRTTAAQFLASTPPMLIVGMTALRVDSRGKITLTTRVRSHPSLIITWGSGEDSGLKAQVIERLLALPENKNILRIDVSDPASPIVAPVN